MFSAAAFTHDRPVDASGEGVSCWQINLEATLSLIHLLIEEIKLFTQGPCSL